MRLSLAATPSPCRQRLTQPSNSSRHSTWSCDAAVIPAPDLSRQDPLFQATIKKTFETGSFCGQVVNVNLDARTGWRAYHVVYEDGDEEDMTAAEVQRYMLKGGFGANMPDIPFSRRRDSAPAELQIMRPPQFQLESESWPPPGALADRITREQGAWSGSFRSWPAALAVCALAIAWASSGCWSCISGFTDGSGSGHIGTRQPWEEQMPPPWEVLASLGAPSSAPQVSDPLALEADFKAPPPPQSSPPVPPWGVQPVPRENLQTGLQMEAVARGRLADSKRTEDLRTGLQREGVGKDWPADAKRTEVAHMPSHSGDTMPPAIPPWKREELATDPYQGSAEQTQQPKAASAQPVVGSPLSGGTQLLSETTLGAEPGAPVLAVPSEREESGESAVDELLMKLRDAWESAARAAKALLTILKSDSSAMGKPWPSESDESSAYNNAIPAACLFAGVLVLLLAILCGGCSHSPASPPTFSAAVISADGDVFHAPDPVPPVGSPSAAGRLSGASPFMDLAATPLAAASPLAAAVPAASPLGARAPPAASPLAASPMVVATPLAASPVAATVPAASPYGARAPPAASQLAASPMAAAVHLPEASPLPRFVPMASPSAALVPSPIVSLAPAAAAMSNTTPKVAAPTPAAKRSRRSPRPVATSTAASSSGAGGSAPPRSKLIQQEPRFRYGRALTKFKEWGYEDTQQLRDILVRCQGNVQYACEFVDIQGY